MDSNSNETLSDESDSTMSSSELNDGSSEDNSSLIEGHDRNSIDECNGKWTTHISLHCSIILMDRHWRRTRFDR